MIQKRSERFSVALEQQRAGVKQHNKYIVGFMKCCLVLKGSKSRTLLILSALSLGEAAKQQMKRCLVIFTV